jgi:hypothetical protein
MRTSHQIGRAIRAVAIVELRERDGARVLSLYLPFAVPAILGVDINFPATITAPTSESWFHRCAPFPALCDSPCWKRRPRCLRSWLPHAHDRGDIRMPKSRIGVDRSVGKDERVLVCDAQNHQCLSKLA